MKILSSKTILILVIILTAILIAANYFFFTSIKKINAETSMLSNELASYKNEQTTLAGRDGLAELPGLIENIDSYSVGKDGVVDFIENVETEARSKGITLLIRSVGTENIGGATEEESVGATKEIMRLKLEARGSWRDTMEFVSYIEHLPYKIVLHDVGFSSASEGESSASSSPTWRARVELTVLKQK